MVGINCSDFENEDKELGANESMKFWMYWNPPHFDIICYKITFIILVAFGWVKNGYYSGLALFRVTIRRLGVFGLANSHYSLFVFCGIAHYSTILTKY